MMSAAGTLQDGAGRGGLLLEELSGHLTHDRLRLGDNL